MAPRIPKETTTNIPLPVIDTREPDVFYEETPIPRPPEVGHIENMVWIGDKRIEIKPTKVRYQRDRTAAFYKALELYPLAQILQTDKGFFDTDRNGDKCVMDWLIAVVDDPKLIMDNYNSMDTELVEKLIEIFRRVNKIDEKEQKLKNMQEEGKGAKKN